MLAVGRAKDERFERSDGGTGRPASSRGVVVLDNSGDVLRPSGVAGVADKLQRAKIEEGLGEGGKGD